MAGSVTTTRQRPPRAPRVERRGSLPTVAPTHPLLALQQQVGNQAVGNMLAPATLPTRATVEGRLSGWRWFGRGGQQSRILKWIDRWHAGISATTPSIRLEFLDRLRALVVTYRTSKAGQDQTRTRQSHVTGLDTLLTEIDRCRQRARTEYQQTDDLPWVTGLDRIQLGADLDALNPTRLTPLGRGALNITYTAIIDTAGTEGVFKQEKAVDDRYGGHRGTPAGIPRVGPNQTGRAVGTYRMAQLMGIAHVVAKTYYTSFGGQTGQLMEQLIGEEGRDDMGGMVASNFRAMHYDDKNLIYWLDLVCGQVDRHAGNMMLETDGTGMTGRVVAFDNDLAFGQNYGIDAKTGASRNTARNNDLSINGKQASDLAITPELAERIIRLSRDPALVRATLAGLLTTAEIDATIARLASLAAYLVRRLSKRDNIIGWT